MRCRRPIVVSWEPWRSPTSEPPEQRRQQVREPESPSSRAWISNSHGTNPVGNQLAFASQRRTFGVSQIANAKAKITTS